MDAAALATALDRARSFATAQHKLLIGGRWLEQAIRAEQGLARGNAVDADFYRGKLQAARYFLTWEVPGCHHELALLEARDDTCLAMQDNWF